MKIIFELRPTPPHLSPPTMNCYISYITRVLHVQHNILVKFPSVCVSAHERERERDVSDSKLKLLLSKIKIQVKPSKKSVNIDSEVL